MRSAFFDHVFIDDFSATPKYQQLANAIISAVRSGKLRQDEVLPSINELSYEFEISRDTAEKGYRHLKGLGVLGSVPGKGYFVRTTQVETPIRIFLLFNKLSEHKKIIYDSFVAALGESVAIDFYIYNNDFALFKRLLMRPHEEYSYFVIIAHFLEGQEHAADVLNAIPKEKLILLDKLITGIHGSFGAVYEDFENDIFGALELALVRLRNYSRLKINFPANTYHPVEILKGFERFCDHYGFSYKVVVDIATETIQTGDVYINLMEKDLVVLIERVQSNKLQVGQDVGIISYNEILLKKFILNGIATISTDFQLMGQRAAELILNRSKEHVAIPFRLRLRDSL